jgi:hypothetical protein
MKKLFLATALVLAFATPSFAASTMSCDEASLTKMKTHVDGMADKGKQTVAMAEFELASTYMKANMLNECQTIIRMMDEKNNNSGGG